MTERFGKFAPMFERGQARVPRYLELLGLHVEEDFGPLAVRWAIGLRAILT